MRIDDGNIQKWKEDKRKKTISTMIVKHRGQTSCIRIQENVINSINKPSKNSVDNNKNDLLAQLLLWYSIVRYGMVWFGLIWLGWFSQFVLYAATETYTVCVYIFAMSKTSTRFLLFKKQNSEHTAYYFRRFDSIYRARDIFFFYLSFFRSFILSSVVFFLLLLLLLHRLLRSHTENNTQHFEQTA